MSAPATTLRTAGSTSTCRRGIRTSSGSSRAPESSSGSRGYRALDRVGEVLRLDLGEVAHEEGDDAGPSRLVAGAQAGAVVSVEVLVEEHQVAPARILLELLDAAVDRPATRPVAEEDAGQARRQLLRDLEEVHHLPGARRALD